MGSFGKKKKKGSGGADAKNKKKIPQGKKARAKAKLDKQWGETAAVIETTTHKNKNNDADVEYKRVGRSRLKAQQRRMILESTNNEKKKVAANTLTTPLVLNDGKQLRQRHHVRHNNRDDDSSTSSNNSIMSDSSHEHDVDEDDIVLKNPLDDFLTMLRRKQSKTKTKPTSKNSLSTTNNSSPTQWNHIIAENDVFEKDDDDDDDSNSSSGASSGDMGTDDGSMDDDEKSASALLESLPEDDPANDDLFEQHFQRPPLMKASDDILSPAATDESNTAASLTKIPIETTSSSSVVVVELQVATPHGRSEDMEALLSSLRSNTNSTKSHWQDAASTTFTSNVRAVLQQQWTRRMHRKKNNQGEYEFMGRVQAPLFSFLSRYCDALVTTCDSGGSSNSHQQKQAKKEQQQMHETYLLHILNHILTSQNRILQNNKLLREAAGNNKDGGLEKENANTAAAGDDQYRDQGFTRPTVLVLLPTRGTCHRFVKDLYHLLGTEMEQEVEERFEADFGEILDPEEEGDDSKKSNLNKEARRKLVLKQKGREWNEMFGESANQDDDFKIGISLLSNVKKNKKKTNPKSPVSVKLYSDFFRSDIIVASPLGLKMLITPDENDEEGKVDFLSSIEICLLQHSDVMLMQNWDHVNDIVAVLNQQPQSNNNTDFSRVRQYYLEDQGTHFRQLILSTKFMDPTLISAFKRFGKSISGSIKVRRKTLNEDASIANVLLPVKQVFQKVPVGSFAQQSQARVDYFVKNLLPQIQKQKQKHTLVFIPSYFDFCSLRNIFLKREDVVFVSVTEYSRTSETGRARARFLQGRKPIMLYTGRAHYFHRHAIKGAKHVIFLGLPEHAEFYTEYVNLIGSVGTATNRKMEEDSDDAMVDHSATSCVVLFSKFEAHALERIVGSSNCSRMLGSSKATFMFHS